MRTPCLFVVGLLLVAFRPAAASFDMYVTVAQPIENAEAGQFEPHDVTYQLDQGSQIPSTEVRLTCAAGMVSTHSAGICDLNAAHLAGFKIETLIPDPDEWSFQVDSSRWTDRTEPAPEEARRSFVDTLRVVLDLTEGQRRLKVHRIRPARPVRTWGSY